MFGGKYVIILRPPIIEPWLVLKLQLTEELFCNQQVVGSNPSAGSIHDNLAVRGLYEKLALDIR